MKIHAYYRHSTTAQDRRSQEAQIADWLNARQLTAHASYEDSASGTTRWQDRAIATALSHADAGDTIIVSEISRIARSTIGVLTFLQAAAQAEITVVAVRNGLALDGSLPSKITVTILALCAEIERDLLSERTKAALAARRLAGQKLGRPTGKSTGSKLTPRQTEITALLKAGVSIRAIARLCKVAPATLYRFIDLKGIDSYTKPLNLPPAPNTTQPGNQP
jgi:DNA invertase Pin-like site-specific DNA recombinase